MSLKLISVNIESHKHLDKILKLIQAEQPDVICFQEVFEVDLPYFTEALGMTAHFVPNADIDRPTNYKFDPLGLWGIAILTKLPTQDTQSQYYVKHSQSLAKMTDFEPNSIDRSVIWTTVMHEGRPFTIATTHFTWSENGDSTPLQAENLAALLEILKPLPELIVCGDFNAPRGRATFHTLTDHFADNIPPQYLSSLDPVLHRVGHKHLMVDGLFTSPGYQARNVKLVSGVSDHQAIVAEIL